MNLQFYDDLIPGTKLRRSEMDGLTGLDFLKKVFFCLGWSDDDPDPGHLGH